MAGHKSGAKQNRIKNSRPMLFKIVFPMSALAALLILIFVGFLTLSGGFSSIKSYSYNMITEKTVNRKSYVENVFNQKTALVYEAAGEVNEITGNILKEKNLTAEDIRKDRELNKQILSECAGSLISLIRRDLVNDAYIILDTGTLYDKDERQIRPGLYMRDTDVKENSTSDNADIFMEMGSSEVARQYGLPLDSGWSLQLDVTDNRNGRMDFYFKPIDTYELFRNEDVPLYNMGYWSRISRISDYQQESIRYSLPLISEDGEVYGVIGIGIMKKTIQAGIPANDFFNESACYILGSDSDGDGSYIPAVYTGASYQRLVKKETVLSTDHPMEYGLWDFTVPGGTECIGSIQKLNFYNSGSPYRGEQWALISVADKDLVLTMYNAMRRAVLFSILFAAVTGIAFSVFTSKRLSHPVDRMIETLEESRKTNQIVRFFSSGITEIDLLASSIIDLQTDVFEYASRVSKIITMSGSGIGVFMYDRRAGSVFVGESLTGLLQFSGLPAGDVTIPFEEFGKQLGTIDRENIILSLPVFRQEEEEEEEEETETQTTGEVREISFTDPETGDVKWLKFSLTKDKVNVIGLVQDITGTVAEKKGIAKAKDDEYMSKLIKANETLQDAYAAAEKANHAKTDFLSRMSHDIRTPMNAIIGMTTIAETHLNNPEKISDCLKKISVSGRFLLSLINEVLDMSKIESGKLVLSSDNINIIELMNELVEMVRPSVRDKKHELKLHLNDVEHEYVIGDRLRIQQVFMNIVSNAVKYTPPGGHIDITVAEKPAGQTKVGCYEFIFADDGNGMTAEFLEKIFEPFERAGDERVNKEQGTGLGMAITYNIVKMMDGNIEVESEPGKGSTFTVTIFLPLQEQAAESQKELSGIRVLVADNDEEEGKDICRLLNDLNMSGEWMPVGENVRRRLKEASETEDAFKTVILGWDASAEKAPEISEDIKGISEMLPVILCSFSDGAVTEAVAGKTGASAFLNRPIFRQGLLTAFRSVFRKDPGREIKSLQETDFSGKRALLVDDNELNCEIASEILKMTGITVEIAENGQEAVDRFMESEAGYYDIIFMDIQMPVMNGYDATKVIRALSREDAGNIPIVAMTANAFAEDVRAAKDAGMDEHIAKPLDLDRLFEILHRWLQ